MAVTPYNFCNFGTNIFLNILFLVVKSLEVTSGFISKLMKKIVDGATIEIFGVPGGVQVSNEKNIFDSSLCAMHIQARLWLSKVGWGAQSAPSSCNRIKVP